MSAPDVTSEFEPGFFRFLADLTEHNDRDWFAANKQRYDTEVLEPALAFIEDFGYRLQAISPHLRADPRRVGGSLFRIHRDTRFSKDKTPYKTHTGMHFRHARAKDVHAPGYYLHLGPGEVFAGGGIWRPDTQTCNRIREAIVADAGGWREATRSSPFTDVLTLGGEQLKRVPSGFDRDHELADDLRRKGWFGSVTLSETTATTPGFLDEYTRICEAGAPLIRFICRALELEF